MGAEELLTSETVSIELPDELSRRARRLAAAANRRLEDAVIDWISQVISEPDVEALPDDELLRLCDATLEAGEQEELSGRLAEAREGTLDVAGRARLDDLMAHYRRGLVLKARAWKEAVARGLRTPPADTDADAEDAA
jgi:predicted transcriptional regulator